MNDPRPHLFIGSSRKALPVARAIEMHLQYVTRTTLWVSGIFNQGAATLESLMRALDTHPFAVLVLTADDVVTVQETTSPSPRDNVLFELGLFMGRHGRTRTFIVQEAGIGLKIPTDLLGITVTSFQRPEDDDGRPDDGGLRSAVSPACGEILEAIERETRAHGRASNARVESFTSVNAAFHKFEQRVASKELQVAAAQFIQHSSEQASGFIGELAKAGANIDLFLQHPRIAQQLSPAHTKQRIEYRISGYAGTLRLARYEGDFRVYLYEAPASVDGFRLTARDKSQILVLGWYAYFHTGPVMNLSDCQINGAEKPCIAIDSAHPDFGRFNEFFEDLLTNHRSQSENRPAFQYPDPDTRPTA